MPLRAPLPSTLGANAVPFSRSPWVISQLLLCLCFTSLRFKILSWNVRLSEPTLGASRVERDIWTLHTCSGRQSSSFNNTHLLFYLKHYILLPLWRTMWIMISFKYYTKCNSVIVSILKPLKCFKIENDQGSVYIRKRIFMAFLETPNGNLAVVYFPQTFEN